MLVNSNTCAWICEHSVDMRKSIDALAVLVEPLFNANPLSGHLFVFLCREHPGPHKRCPINKAYFVLLLVVK